MVNSASLKAWDWATVGLVAVWSETLLYGIYTVWFFVSMYIMLKVIKERTLSAKIFIWSTALIYVVATAHVSIGLYQLLLRYVRIAGTPEALTPWLTTRKWETTAYNSLNVIAVWIFDCLLIYRCYTIWDRDWRVVVAPISLVIASLAIRIQMLAWMSDEDPMSYNPFRLLSFAAVPVILVQNLLTTGLICFRAVRQHRSSMSNAPLDIVRIMLESAAIYSIHLFLMSILWASNSHGYWILFGMNIPIIGIVSTLLTVRVHVATTRRDHKATLSTLSPWMNNTTAPDDEEPQPTQMESPSKGAEKKSPPGLVPETQ